jgi:radical SAM superfamily enzyme YgiQ (UPF0313 family)
MEIVLVNPPNERRTYSYYTHSLGLASIAAVLEENGYAPRIVDFFNEHNWRKIERNLENVHPDIVGITCMTNTRMNAVRIARVARSLYPRSVIVMGGAHPSVMHRQILEHYPVDAVVIGEGELTMLNLARAVEQGKSLDTLKGIAFKRNGEVIRTEPQPFIKDLDSLPVPAYHHFARSERNGKQWFPIRDVVLSRGCPFKCRFCASSNVWGRSYRVRGAKRAVDDIEVILEKSVRRDITINDDSFGLDEERAIEFCREIIRRSLDFSWTAKTRVDCISGETLRWMKKAGCKAVSYGVESGSPEILKNINKGITIDQITRAFELTRGAGINTEATIMIGNPGETGRTVAETERLLRVIMPDHMWVSFTAVYPGTGLYELAKREGLLSDDYWLSDLVAPVYTKSMSFRRMFFHKWKMNLNQLRRRKRPWEFTKSLVLEFHPVRVYNYLKLVARRFRRS